MAAPIAAIAPADARQPGIVHPRKILVGDFLWDVAQRFDVYFTLETKRPTEGTLSPIEVVYFSPDDLNKVSSVEDALKTLRAKLGADAVPDEWNPAVIRIVEKPLSGTPGYAIEQNLPLDYHGSLDGLVTALQKRPQGAIKLQTVFVVPGNILGDPFTTASISEKRIEVRRALTDYVPLSAYRRILWNGQTYFTNGKPTTIVAYSGKRIAPTEDRLPPGKIAPFVDGESAFVDNKDSAAAAKAAVQFIQTEFAKPKPLQVRWAMLYLGKWHREEALPLLLKHLDYKYTTCAIPEESYPALLALTDIGQPAVRAAETALASDTDPRRLELLCRVIVGVDGAAKGKALVESAAARAEKAEHRGKIATALAKALAPWQP